MCRYGKILDRILNLVHLTSLDQNTIERVGDADRQTEEHEQAQRQKDIVREIETQSDRDREIKKQKDRDRERTLGSIIPVRPSVNSELRLNEISAPSSERLSIM